MKKVGIIATAVIIIALVCTGFFFVMKKSNQTTVESEGPTEVQMITTRNLSSDYPLTPRQVVSFYNRIISAYYKENYSDKEFDQLTSQALALFDAQLLTENPKEVYQSSVEQDIKDYKDKSKTIEQWSVCDSNSVKYAKDGDDNIAFVEASYFLKQDKSEYTRTYMRFVLRKDADGNWKILGFYQIDKLTEE